MLKKVIGAIFWTGVTLFAGWFVLSYIDVLAHNLTDHNFADWNFFTMIVKS